MTNLIEEAIKEWYGERCPDYQECCPCCDAWLQFDNLVRLAYDS